MLNDCHGGLILSKGFGLAIPPSLAAGFAAVIRPQVRVADGQVILSRNPDALFPARSDNRPAILRDAHSAADWLLSHHFSGVSAALASDLRASMVTDFVAGVFDSVHWFSYNPWRKLAQLSMPVCVPSTGTPNPAYVDPLKLQSYCKYISSSDTYPVPAVGSVLPQPYPGWSGSVSGGYFQDSYHVQRVFTFPVSVGAFQLPDRPAFFVVDVTLSFTGTSGGNRRWPNVAIAVRRHRLVDTRDTVPDATLWYVQPERKWRLPVAAKTPGWSQTITRRLIFSMREFDGADFVPNDKYISLWLSPVPPSGRYFSLNDSCDCSFDASASVFFAKNF